MSRATAASAKAPNKTPKTFSQNSLRRRLFDYLKRSELPLQSLVFILPALIVFEIGARFRPSDPIALHLLESLFQFLGAPGRLIPGLALVGILLSWHISRKDPWKIRIPTLWIMAFESLSLAIPLLALAMAIARWNFHFPLHTQPRLWRNDAILSLGAGIYEELVFRLILMTLLMMLLADIAKVPHFLASLLMVGTSAILFSLYHYLGAEVFQTRTFLFRTLAGIYFGILFLTRGFGVTCGCHIFYDIIVLALQTH